jgi:hypothetical protein
VAQKFKNTTLPFKLESFQLLPDASCNTKSGAGLPTSILLVLFSPGMFSHPARNKTKKISTTAGHHPFFFSACVALLFFLT